MSVGDQRRTVGVVGLGRMGGPMAGHLAAAGHDVLGCDPDPSATPPDAVRRVGEMADLGECDVVLVTAGGRAVGDILVADGRLRPVWRDRDVLVCSTVDPDEMRRLHAVAAADGGRLLDAPLCRGDHGARQGTLLALVGGDAGVLARTAEVLRAFCSDVVHVGGPGAGQTAKLVNNMLLWSNIASVVEGLRLAEQLGVARGPLVEGLLLSSANSWVLETWARPREIPWADEDMRMVLESAERVGLDAPVSRVVQEAIAEVRRSGAVADGGFGATGWARPAYPTEDEEGSVASG
jgi:3-hydroxyisobutyrate dehydrogenase-like beta-hydroxyacid dehydrogenase